MLSFLADHPTPAWSALLSAAVGLSLLLLAFLL